MGLDGSEHIGRRLREVRHWRQMNLQVVAELAGLSVGYLSRIERGERPVTKRVVLEALAEALRVSPTELSGSPYAPQDPVSSDAHAALASVETALGIYNLGVDPGVPVRPWHELAQEIEHLNTVLRVQADYAAQGAILPQLIGDLHASYMRDSANRRNALVGLIHAYHSATVTTKNLGVRGLPLLAAKFAQECAEQLDDPAWLGFVSWLRGHAAGAQGRQHQYTMSVSAVDALSPHLDDAGCLQMAGMLHLNAALAAAARKQADTTYTHLAEARDLALRLPEGADNFGYLYFGSDNVGVWRVSLATELGEGARVAELARGVDPGNIPAKARQGMFYADLGRALVSEKKTREQGIRTLLQAERTAPQRVRNNVFVRETVADLLRLAQRDAGGRDIRGMAWRMGVAPTG